MGRPSVTVDVGRIEHNARTIVELCGGHGISVTGVTKAACGQPEVAEAMLRGGVPQLGDSRLENVERLRAAGIAAPIMLLRVPMLSGVDEVTRLIEVSLNSEITVLHALSDAALRRRSVHDVILMVDLGDLREGVWLDDVISAAGEVLRLPGVRLTGIGANLTCYGGVIPTEENMARLVGFGEAIEATHDIELTWISGGNSSALPLIAVGAMPARINQVRIGEAILLGRETAFGAPWPGTHQDAFVLRGEVIELKRKPSVPVGIRTQDAFGREPHFVDRGDRWRALVNIGEADTDVSGLSPIDPGLRVIGGSSDYTVVDVTSAEPAIQVGDELGFALSYGALLRAMHSRYVDKQIVPWRQC